MKLISSKFDKIFYIINSVKKTKLFEKAFTHTSYCHQNNISINNSYENLELLGDSILNFHTSYYVFNYFPDYNEGQMSKVKQLMVQESTLAEISKQIGLANFLKLGIGEIKNRGNEKKSILADIYESFLAVLFLIKGNSFVNDFLYLTLFTWIQGKENLTWDYKSKLQEYCQSYKNSVTYQLKKSKMKNNNKHWFVVEVKDKLKTFSALGTGKNIKSAEQLAASKILKKLNIIN